MKKLMTVVLAMLFAASTSAVFAAEGKKGDDKKGGKDAKKIEAKKDDKNAAKAGSKGK